MPPFLYTACLGNPGRVFQTDLSTGQVVKSIPISGAGAHVLDSDGSANLYVGTLSQPIRVAKIRIPDLVEDRVVDLPASYGVLYILYANSRVYASTDRGGGIFELDPVTLAVSRTLSLSGVSTVSGLLYYGGYLYAATDPPTGGRLYLVKIDPVSFTEVGRVELPPNPIFQTMRNLVEVNGTLFILGASWPQPTRIWQVDPNSMALLRWQDLLGTSGADRIIYDGVYLYWNNDARPSYVTKFNPVDWSFRNLTLPDVSRASDVDIQGQSLYVTNITDPSVLGVIDLPSFTQRPSIPLGGNFFSVQSVVVEPLPTTGNIAGSVRDTSTQALIPNCTVSIYNSVGNLVWSTISPDGNYSSIELQPGNYTVTASKTGYVTDSVAASVTAGQTTTANLMLTIISSPLSLSISASQTSGVTPLTVNFTAVASGGVQPYSFLWEFGDGTVGSGQSVSKTYSTAGSYIVYCTVRDSGGGVETKSIVITVLLPLTLSISTDVVSGDTPLTVKFGASASGGLSPYSYLWDFGDGWFSSLQNPSYTYFNAGVYTAVCTVIDSEGRIVSKSITVTATTPLFLSISASPTSGPAPLTVGFSASPSGGRTPYSYSWEFGDGSTSTSANPSKIYGASGAFIASCVVRDADGRQASDTVLIDVKVPVNAGQVSGAVLDLSNELPLVGAEVMLHYPSGEEVARMTTLKNGNYSFVVAEGIYDAHISKSGYIDYWVTIAVVIGQNLILDVALAPTPPFSGLTLALPLIALGAVGVVALVVSRGRLK